MGKDLNGKELGEGLCQRKNGSYCARYNDRFGKRMYLYDSDLKSLRNRLVKAKYEDIERLNVVDADCTLNEWFEKWMFTYKQDTVRENTKTTYTRIYRQHIKERMGMLPISEITHFQVQNLINAMKKDNLGWEMQNKARIILVDMFNKAMIDGFVRKIPARGVRLSNKPKDERRVLTKDEQADFLECAAGTFYHNLFVVAVNTGLRPGELYALTWDDVDLERKTISVSKTLVYQEYLDDDGKQFHMEEPKTKMSKRLVPINSYCEKALKKQYIQKRIIARKDIRPTAFPDLLFTTRFNTPLNAQVYLQAIEKVVDEINVMRDNADMFERFSGHTFRHTFATRCIEAGIQPKTLQTYLGHATLQMTMDLYVHTTDEHMFCEMELLENELGRLHESDSTDNKYLKEAKAESKLVRFKEIRTA